MAHARVWMSMDFRPSAALPPRPSWSRSILLLIFSFQAERKPTFHPHSVAAAAQVVQGFDPQISVTRLRIRHAGWGGQTWEGRGALASTPPHLSTPSYPPRSGVWLVSLGFFMARWDAVVTEDTCPPPPHQPFQNVQSLLGLVWGAAVGGAGCGSHGHARGAGGGYRLPDVRHEEGVTGQLVHIDAVLLSVD